MSTPDTDTERERERKELAARLAATGAVWIRTALDVAASYRKLYPSLSRRIDAAAMDGLVETLIKLDPDATPATTFAADLRRHARLKVLDTIRASLDGRAG